MRLFVAVDPGPGASARCATLLSELTPISPRARWVRADALHITLAFLGEVQEDQLAGIEVALAEACRAAPPLSIGIEGAGSFGSTRAPRVLWLGLTGDREGLLRLQRGVADALAPLGFTPEARAFSPHLTLARAREPRGDPGLATAMERLRDVRTEIEERNEIIVYQTRLERGGARYAALVRIPIGITAVGASHT